MIHSYFHRRKRLLAILRAGVLAACAFAAASDVGANDVPNTRSKKGSLVETYGGYTAQFLPSRLSPTEYLHRLNAAGRVPCDVDFGDGASFSCSVGVV